MDTINAVLDAMDEVLGLDKTEMQEMLDTNLMEEELIDSLSVITLINTIGRRLGMTIDLKRLKPEDFLTVRAIAAAVDAQKD